MSTSRMLFSSWQERGHGDHADRNPAPIDLLFEEVVSLNVVNYASTSVWTISQLFRAFFEKPLILLCTWCNIHTPHTIGKTYDMVWFCGTYLSSPSAMLDTVIEPCTKAWPRCLQPWIEECNPTTGQCVHLKKAEDLRVSAVTIAAPYKLWNEKCRRQTRPKRNITNLHA